MSFGGRSNGHWFAGCDFCDFFQFQLSLPDRAKDLVIVTFQRFLKRFLNHSIRSLAFFFVNRKNFEKCVFGNFHSLAGFINTVMFFILKLSNKIKNTEIDLTWTALTCFEQCTESIFLLWVTHDPRPFLKRLHRPLKGQCHKNKYGFLFY